METRVVDGKVFVRVSSNRVVTPGSPPDIDTDFHTAHRDAAFEHVAKLYGEDHVARLPTNQMLKARASLKDSARIYGIPPAQANYVTSLLPESLSLTFSKVFDPNSEEYAGSARFRDAVKSLTWSRALGCAKALEGKARGRGVHACGLLISSEPLQNHIAVDTAKDGTKVAGFEYGACEKMGIIKFDFLGLDTVDILCDAARMAIESGKDVPDFRSMVRNNKFDDPAVYELLGKGETVGIFQLGNSAVADLFTKFTPCSLEHISAITALYRPGPMSTGAHIRYVERMSGREPISSLHPDFKGSALDDILHPTAGLLVYQEQVMSIASVIAGMSPQEGDDLRRAIGKKKHDLMAMYEERLISGGVGNGFSREAMQVLWDTIVGFAEYGFNKSHSYGYAIMAYLALYLKAHYPAEFYAAAISRKVQMGSAGRDKVFELVEDAKRRGIRLDVPDINASNADIGLNSDGNLAFGFSLLKGVGAKDSELIVGEREAHGLYAGFNDFMVRTFNAGGITKTAYVALAKAGAFDVFGVSRKAVVECVPVYLDVLRKERAKLRRVALREAKAAGSVGGVVVEGSVVGVGLPDEGLLVGGDYPVVERLKFEAEVAGQYMSGHPMGLVPVRVPVLRGVTIGELLGSGRAVRGAVVMAAVVAYSDKTHKRFGRKVQVTLDDGTGMIVGYLSRGLLEREGKWLLERSVRGGFEAGGGVSAGDVGSLRGSVGVLSSVPVEAYGVYSLLVDYTPERKVVLDDGEVVYRPAYLSVLRSRPVLLSADGEMCARLRVDVARSEFGGDVGKVVEVVRAAVGEFDGGVLVPLVVGFVDSSLPYGGVDTPGMFVRAGEACLRGEADGEWGAVSLSVAGEVEPLMTDEVVADRVDYQEVGLRVPFVRGVAAALSSIFGSGSFDWGHLRIK